MTQKRFPRAGESRARKREKGIVGGLPVRVQKAAAKRARPGRGHLMRVEYRDAHAPRRKGFRDKSPREPRSDHENSFGEGSCGPALSFAAPTVGRFQKGAARIDVLGQMNERIGLCEKKVFVGRVEPHLVDASRPGPTAPLFGKGRHRLPAVVRFPNVKPRHPVPVELDE